MVERFREELSTEKLVDRLTRILAEAGAVLDAQAVPPAAGMAAPSTGSRRRPKIPTE